MKTRILTLATILLIAFMSVSVTSTHERRFREDNVQVEEWMTHPFDTALEEALEVEEWMTKPFVTK